MTLIEKIDQLGQLDSIINRKGTGTADELADRLGMCRRSVFYNFDRLRYYGADIKFCYERNSYVYIDDIRPNLPIVPKQNANKLRGGKTFLNFFSRVQYFCTPASDLCTKLKDEEEHDEASRYRFLESGY